MSATVDLLAWVASAREDHERVAALLGVLVTRLRTRHAPVEVAAVEGRRRAAPPRRGGGVAGARPPSLRRRAQGGSESDRRRRPPFALGDIVTRRPRPTPRPSTSRRASSTSPTSSDVVCPTATSARDLGISERTAQGHVQNILRKLGFTSRTQVAAWVADRNARAVTGRATRERVSLGTRCRPTRAA